MKKEIVFVPKGKFPLDILKGMREETKHAWVYVHENVIKALKRDCIYSQSNSHEVVFSNDAPHFQVIRIEFGVGEWKKIIKFSSKDYTFENECIDPEHIIFLKIEE